MLCKNKTSVPERQFLSVTSALFAILFFRLFVLLLLWFASMKLFLDFSNLGVLQSCSTAIIIALLHKKRQRVKMTPSGILGE